MNPLLQQLSAALAGRYDIEREIGAGGMATVYLAADARHHRKVAVKLLNPELGAVLGAERFLAEIRVTANLQHPNLLPLFDSGEVGGLLFYVMPFVEGETLRARLDREKQLPIEEALRISTAIASALDYAHRHGVIHRDLKPENILLHDGQPLIADFGIALAVSNAGGARVTQTGLSLGTPQYMSPEQATGDRGIDGRTDIYSLGALTYEMLAGEPPHTGSSAQAIIAKLMTEEPRPISVQRRAVPQHVEDAIECALQKLPADRFATAKEFSDALNGRVAAHPTSGSHTRREAARRKRSPLVMAGVALAAATIGALAAYALRPATETTSIQFLLSAAGPAAYGPTGGRAVAFSPDGRSVAYQAIGQGNGILAIRHLDAEQPQLLPGTEGGNDLMYSPDGKRIAFHTQGRVFVTAVDGTRPTLLTTIGAWQGITWVDDRTIVYEVADTLWAVDVATAAKRVVTVEDSAAGEVDINTPMGMPDGKTVAFTVFKGQSSLSGENYLAFVSLDGSNRVVTSIASRALFGYLDGWLLHSAPVNGSIMAVRFDLGPRKATGDAVRLADSAQVPNAFAAALSRKGDLMYVRGSRGLRLSVLDPKGDALAAVPEIGTFTSPEWSPDGKRIAHGMPGVNGGPAALWMFDPAAGTTARLATTMSSGRPSWSPDGKRIAFIGNASAVYVVPSDGSATEKLLYEVPGTTVREVAFTPAADALVLTINAVNSPTKRDIVLAPLDGGARTTLVATPADENHPAVSRDGRWLAYKSTESGRDEVYVRLIKGATGSAMVSRGGGTAPRWTRDGRIVYFDASGVFRRVELTSVGGLPAVGKRDSLFHPQAIRVDLHQSWDLSADGRFVVIRNATSNAEIVVTTNWWQRNLMRLRER